MHSQPPMPYSERFAAELRRRGVEAHHLTSLASAPAVIEELAQIIRTMLRANRDTMAPTERISFTDVKIEDTDLEVRVKHSLDHKGIDSIGVLSLMTKRQVSVIPRVGTKSLQEIEDVLREHGLSFLDEHLETAREKAERIDNPSEYVRAALADPAQEA